MTHMMAQQQQLAVRDTNHAYLESRANAVDAVQGTIAELGNIFQARGRVKVRVTGRGRGRAGVDVSVRVMDRPRLHPPCTVGVLTTGRLPNNGTVKVLPTAGWWGC